MLDAIIISDTNRDTYSASSPFRLQIGGKVASIQNLKNYIKNKGNFVNPIEGEKENNWQYSFKLNGIAIYDCLQKAGYNVDLLDSYYSEKSKFAQLIKKNPKIVIISTTFTLNKRSLAELTRDIRSVAPDIFIVAGGPFVFSSYLLLKYSKVKVYDVENPKEDYLFLNKNNRPDVDLFIIDKFGEQSLPHLLRCLENNLNVDHLPNTAYWNGTEYVFSERKELPLHDMSIAWQNMPDKIFEPGVINIQASIGCPFNCEFCNFVKDKRYTFMRPFDQIIEELKIISEKGVKYIRFVDDNFRLGKNDLDSVCNRLINANVDLKWMSFLRASTLDQANIELLKKSGCIEAQIGVESADKSILKNMNKKADPEMYHRVISRLLDAGINCSCCFIIGFPGETQDSFQRTMEFIESIFNERRKGIFYWSIYPFILAPLSPIYEAGRRAKYNLEGYMNNWKHSSMDSIEAYEKIKELFLKIETTSPIYSGDNIDMIMDLSLKERNKFLQKRHYLAKHFLEKPFDSSLILKTFSNFFK